MIDLQFNLYMVPLLAASVVTSILSWLGWRRRAVPGANTFLLLMVAVTVYSLAYALELGSQNLFTIVVWAKIQYIGLVFVPVLWLFHALIFTNRGDWLTPRRIALLALVPCLTLLVAWTNEWHHLLWDNITINREAGFAAWQSDYGPWFNVHVVYSQVNVFAGTVLILQLMLRSARLYWRQVTVVMIAVLAPWLASILFLVGNPFLLNPIPFGFTITGVAMAWAMFRWQFLELVPIARTAILDSMVDAVVVLDPQRRVIDLNPALQQLLPCSPDEAIGREIVALLPPLSALFASEAGGSCQPQSLPLEIEGRQRFFDLQCTPLYDYRHYLTGYLLILHDITAQREVEMVLRAAKEEAEAANRAKSAFLATVSHELRTPLTAILGYTELMQRIAEDNDYDLLISKIERTYLSGKRLLMVINDLLNMSSLESGQVKIERDLFDVSALIHDLSQQVKPACEASGNRFLVRQEVEPGLIYSDYQKLRQVLLYLLDNAIKFTDQGDICLGVEIGQDEEGERQLIFQVADTGVGILPEYMTHLFDPFSQADNSSTRQYDGSGLGLAISYRYCQLLEAELLVESELGRGSTFTIKHPAPVVDEEMMLALANQQQMQTPSHIT